MLLFFLDFPVFHLRMCATGSEIGYHSNHMEFSYFVRVLVFVPVCPIACWLDWPTTSLCRGLYICLLSVCYCLAPRHSNTAPVSNHTLTISLQQPPIPTAASWLSLPRQQPRWLPERRSPEPQRPWVSSLQQRDESRSRPIEWQWRAWVVRQRTLCAPTSLVARLSFTAQRSY